MRRTNNAAINHDVTLACMDPWGRAVDVPTTLGYRIDDPYAVSLTFHAGSGDVVWMMARDVLVQGLASPAGEGDIRVYPSIDDEARAVTVLDFCSPDGRLVGQAGSREVQEFLVRTIAAVPLGQEGDFLDIDLLAETLLGSLA